MAATIDELTIEYKEGDQITVQELDKVVLTKGAWTTIVYQYQDWDNTKQDYGPIKFSIRRYQKRNGEYMQRSKFNISSVDQAKKVIEVLSNWIGEIEAA